MHVTLNSQDGNLVVEHKHETLNFNAQLHKDTFEQDNLPGKKTMKQNSFLSSRLRFV